MPVARFQMPDGRIARFEVPEGTTPEQANAQIQQMIAGGSMQPPVQPSQPAQQPMQQQEQQDKGFVDRLEKGIQSVPGGSALAEFGAGVSRGAVGMADFFTTKPARYLQSLAGVPEEDLISTIADTEFGQAATTGNNMEPGLARDVVRTSGELVAPGAVGGAAFRGAAQAIPKVQAGATSLGQRLTQQMGGSTAGQDVIGAAASGAGAVVGEEYGGQPGAIAGAMLTPMVAFGTPNLIKGAFKAGKNAVSRLTEPLKGMSDEGASAILAEQMVREGLSPDDVVKRLQELGPEGMTADVAPSFARLLRLASNKIPRIQGAAGEALRSRQAGQGNRILNAFDDATGTASLSVDDEIVRLNQALKPQINELYKQAGQKSVRMSPRLRNMLDSKSSLGKAQRKAQQRLRDKRAAGDEITNIDVIDATKQEMDDQIGRAIRQGENNKARDLVRLKNVMVNEADSAIPEYKQARDMFAGKASLENAADSGQMFLKLKPRDVDELTRTFGQSEKHMFKLGAKQAILDKLDDLRTNADAVKRIFGKNGDVKKLRSLFDSEEDFSRFSDTLKRESDFIITRNAAQANSTTAQQLSDEGMGYEVLRDVAEASASPTGVARIMQRISDGLRREKSNADYIKALEDAGDILLIKGIEPERIVKLLRQGTAKGIKTRVEQALKQPTIKAYKPATVIGSTIETADQAGFTE